MKTPRLAVRGRGGWVGADALEYAGGGRGVRVPRGWSVSGWLWGWLAVVQVPGRCAGCPSWHRSGCRVVCHSLGSGGVPPGLLVVPGVWCSCWRMVWGGSSQAFGWVALSFAYNIYNKVRRTAEKVGEGSEF